MKNLLSHFEIIIKVVVLLNQKLILMFKKIALVCLVSLMSFQAKAQEKKTQIYLDDSQPIEPE